MLLLPRQSADTLDHGEVNWGKFDGALHDAHEIRVDPLQPL
jgi:hypothetical protein